VLQINTIFSALIGWTIVCAGHSAATGATVNWLLEDALKEENVPLIETDIISPKEVVRALDYYKAGNYRFAVHILEKIRDLNLPDGKLDFNYFASAECYRQLNLGDCAIENYRFIINRCPGSDKAAPSYFRLLQYAYDQRDSMGADSITAIFRTIYRNHPLFASAIYVRAKLYFRQGRWTDAIALCAQEPANSSLYVQSQFLTALCYLQSKDVDKALLILDYVRKNSFAEALVAEATIVIGDIYYNKDKFTTALTYYGAVAHSAKRYPYAVIKTARLFLEMKQYEKARDIAKDFIAKNKSSEYYFEMLSILEQVYGRLKDGPNQERTKAVIFQQLKNARNSFEVYDELSRTVDMISQWEIIEFTAIRRKDDALLKAARDNLGRLKSLKNRLGDLLDNIGNSVGEKGQEQVAGMEVRRYLDLLKNRMAPIDDTIRKIHVRMDSLRTFGKPYGKQGNADSLIKTKEKAFETSLDTFKLQHASLEREYALVQKECLGGLQGRRRLDEEMQAKFVDWAFIRYQAKKTELTNMNKELMKSGLDKANKTPLKQKGNDVAKLFAEIDVDKANRELADERTTLINHIQAMVYVYPRSVFTPAILTRLAELYYDKSSDEFDVKLRAYEKKLAEGQKSITFPEFDLKNVIETYDRIIHDYPKDDMAANACFYKALALQKLGKYDEANATLVDLTKNYPESEYYVEANMNIARYYFEHPKIQGGTGYKLAEETYHKVLYFRDHPQFVSALYSLGWCYYMQDKYDEAIAVFKYLVEEVALDFDVTKIDEKKQVMNPLLRDEAIDYIAISFDEENRMDDAIKFLSLIGNIDYAAMVLRRIAELREEDMDYKAAIHAYERLLAEYPQSIAAPEASLGIIKMYEMLNQRDEAKKQREDFFKRYARGGQWQELVWKRDSLLIPRVDSIAISMGQFIADESYRAAETKNDTAAFAKAAQYYKVIVNAYPNKPRSQDAQWNLAVILDNKLSRTADAYAEYLTYSANVSGDPVRREQAALNAIAIAQKMMPPDSSVKEGVLEPASFKVVDAVNNYKALFPKGKNLSGALLTIGSIYFNRKMFAKAAEYYDIIIGKGEENDEYYEALFLLGQCHFGRENWEAASKCFDKVWKNTSGAVRKSQSYKLLLQSEFSRAKQAMASQAYKDASQIFLSIETRYPGSEYGDVVLFKAAECFEKTEKWVDACDGYYRIVKNYPRSKLAPNALFNAALDFEKANKFDKAAEAYELLISSYPESDKTKDALFNLGLCYEKLGNMDKVAEANERYTRMFPGEKDVETMLLRTAQYYAKANLSGKAVTVYRNFIRQYPQSPKTVEALFMIGKSFLDRQDRENAYINFNQAEQQHIRLVSAGAPGNSYYAAEAAFALATMKREDFVAIKFVLPDAKFKADQKTKSSLLLDASKAFEHVIQYQSERMFESAYWIGQMYEDLAEAWKNQERPKMDPIKMAVLEKDVALMSSTLLQKSFIPYKKAIELSVGFDSLNAGQKMWVYKTKVSFARTIAAAGSSMVDAYAAMQNAPVPQEIRNKPLYFYQYQKQLLETIEPMKLQARQYFLWAYRQLDSLKMIGENSKKCIDECMRINFLLGNEYDKLSEKMLREPEIPKDMKAAEKEELLFQLEDIVYELQDKAISNYEEALRMSKKENLPNNEYNGKIMQALARLSPDTWGKNFYKRVILATGRDWKARPDSVARWNFKEGSDDGWKSVGEAPPTKPAVFPFGNPLYIWQDSSDVGSLYLKKHLFFNGVPRDAAIHFALDGKYWLFVNGTLTASDTAGKHQPDRRDSIAGISKLFTGGDNEVSLHVISTDSLSRGVAMAFSLLIDTSQHFVSSRKYAQEETDVYAGPKKVLPASASAGRQDNGPAQSEKTGGKTEPTLFAKNGETVSNEPTYDHEFRNRGELLKAITDYDAKAQNVGLEIKKERLSIQKLQIKRDDVEQEIRKVKDEIAGLKKSMEDMKRTK
jgi:TolA-binding protein